MIRLIRAQAVGQHTRSALTQALRGQRSTSSEYLRDARAFLPSTSARAQAVACQSLLTTTQLGRCCNLRSSSTHRLVAVHSSKFHHRLPWVVMNPALQKLPVARTAL